MAQLGILINRRNIFTGILCIFLLALAACNHRQAQEEDQTEKIDMVTKDTVVEKDLNKKIYEDYTYPQRPAQHIQTFLAQIASNHAVPIIVGEVEYLVSGTQQYAQIKIDFTNQSENQCIITFINVDIYGYRESVDGFDNPSFTISFRDPDNSQDMIMILKHVLQYLSPTLTSEQAENLAVKQDETISTDGYAMPLDIGGYQVQAQYANPNVFFQTDDFQAKFGVRVTALEQLWGTVNIENCKKLTTLQDFDVLERKHWVQKEYPEYVYGDFIVKDVWKEQSYIHGETWDTIDVEAEDGQRYTLTLNTWEYPHTYEFGIGQRYTIYVRLNFREGIIYAIQRSQSSQPNARGEAQPIDYPAINWKEPITRIEPKGQGTIYNVCFALESQMVGGEAYAALEGQGVGKEQWPENPIRENYAFVGWYDDYFSKGEPYTPDTPIEHDTTLYAKWKYVGTGGTWPRAHRGHVEISNNATEGEWHVIAPGYNMDIEKPKDQRFRWVPLNWALSDGTNGQFPIAAPFQITVPFAHGDEKMLFVTYEEEIFDGIEWQKTGQQHEVEEKKLSIASTDEK